MKKIYIGPSNISNLSSQVAKALNFIGIKADFITWSSWKHPFHYEYGKVFRIIKDPPFKVFGKNIFYFFNEYFLKPIYFCYALFNYDVFLFIKPATFLRNNLDLKILKFFHKQVGVFMVGCPDRDLNYDSDKEYICNTCTDITKRRNSLCNEISKKIAKVNSFEKYANFIFGLNDTLSYVKDKSKTHQFIYPMPAIKIKASEKNFNTILRISHLPSNPLLKGTNIIEPVLNRLVKEEKIEVTIKKETWSREKLIEELQSTHILIDSIASYTFGTICLEAIHYGCVALNAYPDWIAENYEIPPIVKITKDTLYDTLKQLINDRDLLRSYAERSQEAYNRYFVYNSSGNYYKGILNNSNQLMN